MLRTRNLVIGLLCATFALGALSPAFAQATLPVRLVALTSPAYRGNAASITVKTVPDAACTITVIYKSGPSRARGLVPKTADAKGLVTWTWVVGTRTTPGRWPITVVCASRGVQGTLDTSFVVQ